MKHRFAIAVAVVVAAAGLGTSLAFTGGASAATTRASAGSGGAAGAVARNHVVLDCSFKPVVEPSGYILACADAGTSIEKIHWVAWTPSLASGYGTFEQNTCTPDCASGHFATYPVVFTFWGNDPVKGYPADHRFTNVTVTFTGKRAPVYTGPHTVTYPRVQDFATSVDLSS